MNIHIATFGKVVIDDQDSGDVFAACRANPSAAADIEQRAMAYVSRLAEADARVTQLDRDTNAANTALASLRKENEELRAALADATARVEALTKDKQDSATNAAELETIRANTKTAITKAAQFLQCLTQTELSEAQAAAVSGLGGVIAFAAKSEIQRQYDAAQSALAAAQAKADELAAQLS